MYIKVGVYELNTSEEFKTEKEAVSRFLEAFPDANPEKVKAKVKPYFKKDAQVPSKSTEASPDSKVRSSGENIEGSREAKPERKVSGTK